MHSSREGSEMSGRACGQIESKVFPGPFVRVRGRLSRKYEVEWSPALRTERGPGETGRDRTAARQDQYTIDFLDYTGKVLESGPAALRFFAKDQETAKFIARLLYNDHTDSLRLRRGERVLSRHSVPTDRPCFTLLSPGEDACIDGSGVLHLRWCPHDSQYPMTFYVRYSHDAGKTWVRPGVNLRAHDYYLDLREMAGGKRCVVQVLATNGYRTSYVQTRYFEVPVKPPEILLGDAGGPVLFAQGFSREGGPIPGDNLVWLIDGIIVTEQAATRRGGSLDVRTLPLGTYQISIQVTDQAGRQRVQLLGTYDSSTGLRIGPAPL
jgi:hypothetical protein